MTPFITSSGAWSPPIMSKAMPFIEFGLFLLGSVDDLLAFVVSALSTGSVGFDWGAAFGAKGQACYRESVVRGSLVLVSLGSSSFGYGHFIYLSRCR